MVVILNLFSDIGVSVVNALRLLNLLGCELSTLALFRNETENDSPKSAQVIFVYCLNSP